jgi:hypothetical protein
VTLRSHWMQKQKFSIVTCPRVLFMETVPGPPEHEKECVDISRPKCFRMHYVIRRSHRMQKHKFGVTRPVAHFMETAPGRPKHEK